MRILYILILLTLFLGGLEATAQRIHLPRNATSAQLDSIYAAQDARQEWWKEQVKDFGRNFIRIYPIYQFDVPGLGFGVDYERVIGKKKNIGLVLPVSYVSVTTLLKEDNRPNTVFICPGIKYYFGKQKKVNFAMGANLFLGYGEGVAYRTYWFDTSPDLPPTQRGKEYINYRVGFSIGGCMNLQISPNICLNLETGIGA